LPVVPIPREMHDGKRTSGKRSVRGRSRLLFFFGRLMRSLLETWMVDGLVGIERGLL
jgi:hypothetical protein